MRVSVNKNDKGFVVVECIDAKGHFIIKDDKIAVKTLRGKVKIIKDLRE